MAANDETPLSVPLRSLGGASAAPELARDLLRMMSFPPAARQQLWALLGPCTAERVPTSLETEIETFERAFALPADALPLLLRACRVLVRSAALRGIDAAALAADAFDLTGSDEPGRVLGLGYEAACLAIRREAMRAALLDHGAVLDAVEWRVDHVGASSRRDGLKFAFAVLTMRYENEGRRERLTLQVTPDALVQLAQACGVMLGTSPPVPPGETSGSSPTP
jgi:hypothetical protein